MPSHPSRSPQNRDALINERVLVLGVVVGLAGLLIALESYTGWKVFTYVPAFVLLLGCDLRRTAQLGPKLLLTFFVTMLSIMGAFIAVFALFRAALSTDVLSTEAWIPMASPLGSWTGGSANTVPVDQGRLHTPRGAHGSRHGR